MKNVAKRIRRSIWRLTGSVRRPFARRLSLLIQRSTVQAIREEAQPQLGELFVGLAIARREVGTYRNETNLLLDSLVRELTRLQDEVASLREELAADDMPATIPDMPATIPIVASSARNRELAESA